MIEYTNGRLPFAFRALYRFSRRSRAIIDGLAKAAKGNVKDDLTGLDSRGYFNKRLLLEILENERALRDGNPENPFGVIFSDIDDFKQINDK